MTNYTQTTDFSAKDALTTGDAEKAISGADVDGEFSAISTHIATKVDKPGSPSTNDVLAWSGSAWAAVSMATKADMEAASSAAAPVVPSVLHNHPGVAKAWIFFDGASPDTTNSYNVSGIVDNGTGDYTINWDTDFSSASYAYSVCAEENSSGNQPSQTFVENAGQAAGSLQIRTYDNGGNVRDFPGVSVIAWGDQ